MKQYDPNPDVNEVLVYSGAGEAAERRHDEKTNAILWEAMEQSQERMFRASMAAQDAARRSDVRFIGYLIALVIIYITFLLLIW
jgi:hypothetical protein